MCGAQQYRALMMTLQCHKLLYKMLSHCLAHVLLRHPRSCLLRSLAIPTFSLSIQKQYIASFKHCACVGEVWQLLRNT